jgi:RHS repeat-associated protein
MLTSTDPNGVTTTYTYTPGNLKASVSYSGSSAHSVSYTYDADGNKTGMTDATGTSSYAYDPFGELTSAANGVGQTVTYSYDADGNIVDTSYPLPGTATWATSHSVTYEYDNADHLMSVTDFNGNQLAITNTANGQPSSISLGSTGDTLSTTYDQANEVSQISLNRSSNALQSFSYTYSPADTILTRTDTPASAQSPAAYSYDAQGRITSMSPGTNPALTYAYDPSGNLTALPSGASGSYDDALDSVRGTINSTGSLTATMTYDAWGNPSTAGGLTALTPFGFAGGYTDPTGLIYLEQRYYDPQTGQFTSLDPLVGQTLQPYAYANGDPVDQTDPTGGLSGVSWGYPYASWDSSGLTGCVGPA